MEIGFGLCKGVWGRVAKIGMVLQRVFGDEW